MEEDKEMQKIIESLDDVRALSQSLALSVMAPAYGVGEADPECLHRIANMITTRCDQIISKINQAISTLNPRNLLDLDLRGKDGDEKTTH
jgi:hypothetical protein